MSKSSGGSAFPVPKYTEFTEYQGMTLRDYFVAHAPFPVPDWFTPVIATDPDETIFVSTDGKRHYSVAQNALRSEGVQGYTTMHRRNYAPWSKEYEKEKFLQWPYFWADEQIKRGGV